MTIDEAIRYLNTHDSLDNRNAEDREAVQKLVNTITWYIEQDLIQREPLLAFIYNTDIRRNDWLCDAISNKIRFPKAAPPEE